MTLFTISNLWSSNPFFLIQLFFFNKSHSNEIYNHVIIIKSDNKEPSTANSIPISFSNNTVRIRVGLQIPPSLGGNGFLTLTIVAIIVRSYWIAWRFIQISWSLTLSQSPCRLIIKNESFHYCSYNNGRVSQSITWVPLLNFLPNYLIPIEKSKKKIIIIIQIYEQKVNLQNIK